jgi:protein phosphatase 2C family protein 2/3
MTRCLAPDCEMGGLGCDNMTVIIVCFLMGGTYDDLVKRCSRPSPAGPSTHIRGILPVNLYNKVLMSDLKMLKKPPNKNR